VNILVVGGAGYVGGSLVDYLISRNHNVTVYDNLTYETRYLKPVQFVEGDIRETSKLLSLISRSDIVVWLAAIVGDGACALSPVLANEINCNSVKWLAENCDKKIIFMSTCSVYGANSEILNEQSSTNPLSVYASVKLTAEQHLLTCKKNCVIFRLGTLFGIGDTYSRVRFDLVVNMLTQMAASNKPLTVFGGQQWRPLLHVKDVALAINFAIEKNLTGLYNLHMDNYTVNDIAHAISQVVSGCIVKHEDKMFEDSRNYQVSSDKFRSHGWLPNFTLKQGISEIYELIKSKRIKNVEDPVYYNVHYLRSGL
jgi:nucleoside-diphosphate-sugar epimerase